MSFIIRVLFLKFVDFAEKLFKGARAAVTVDKLLHLIFSPLRLCVGLQRFLRPVSCHEIKRETCKFVLGIADRGKPLRHFHRAQLAEIGHFIAVAEGEIIKVEMLFGDHHLIIEALTILFREFRKKAVERRNPILHLPNLLRIGEEISGIVFEKSFTVFIHPADTSDEEGLFF